VEAQVDESIRELGFDLVFNLCIRDATVAQDAPGTASTPTPSADRVGTAYVDFNWLLQFFSVCSLSHGALLPIATR
jgi:hypothetical protein